VRFGPADGGENGGAYSRISPNHHTTNARCGRGKASSVTKELHAKLVELAERVEDGSLLPYRGAVCAQLINTRIRLIELEKKIAEQHESEERLARIEALERGRGRGGRTTWGA
jgi:hypothetical protein